MKYKMRTVDSDTIYQKGRDNNNDLESYLSRGKRYYAFFETDNEMYTCAFRWGKSNVSGRTTGCASEVE